MREIILDGGVIANEGELHAVLKEALALPEHYGHNLDALWDCLTGWVDLPLTIRWLNFRVSEQRFGAYSHALLELFQEAEQEMEGFHIRLES